MSRLIAVTAVATLLVLLALAAGVAHAQNARKPIAEKVHDIGVNTEVQVALEQALPNEPFIQGHIRAIDADTFDVLTTRGDVRRLAYAEVWRLEPTTSKHRALSWAELDRALARRDVTITLPSGVRIEGRVTAVKGNQLEMNVKRSSDARLQPKGPAAIPRASISSVHVRGGNTTGKIVGASVGGALAVPLWIGLAISANELGSGATGAEFLVVPAFAVLGGLIGSVARGEGTLIDVVQ